MLMSKIIFKNKKHHSDTFLNKKYFENHAKHHFYSKLIFFLMNLTNRLI